MLWALAFIIGPDWGLMLEMSAFKIFTMANSVNDTKLPCYTPPPTQQHGFLRNLPSLLKYRADGTCCLLVRRSDSICMILRGATTTMLLLLSH